MIEVMYYAVIMLVGYGLILALSFKKNDILKTSFLPQHSHLYVSAAIVFFVIFLILPVTESTDRSYYLESVKQYVESGYLDQYLLNKEVGFYYVVKSLALLFPNGTVVVATLSSVTLTLLLIGYTKIFENKRLGAVATIVVLMLWFHIWSVNGIRQAMAISFFVIAFSFMLREKYLKAVLIILAGSFFHFSSVYMLVFITAFIAFKKKGFRVSVLSHVIFLFFALFVASNPDLINSLTSPLMEMSQFLITSEYFHYLEKSTVEVRSAHTGIGIGLAFRCVIFIYVILTMHLHKYKPYYNYSTFSLVLLLNLLLVMLGSIELITRALLYLYILIGYLLVGSIKVNARSGYKYMQYIGTALAFASSGILFAELSGTYS
ncbi:EpsG family protein [Pseudidiomarina terrestris]|uniref:EpsG family protein n=1 Tax=Pseudidiomarina terrestris TaxID=2820060 RepID=UPI00264EC3C8|nr:EpsG family protein [Pseudidiomarina sp. 1ASP75-5]MDN7134537.1 EpsG family protein [Pseudidiomarina sp. 1ASP75-5]